MSKNISYFLYLVYTITINFMIFLILSINHYSLISIILIILIILMYILLSIESNYQLFYFKYDKTEELLKENKDFNIIEKNILYFKLIILNLFVLLMFAYNLIDILFIILIFDFIIKITFSKSALEIILNRTIEIQN